MEDKKITYKTNKYYTYLPLLLGVGTILCLIFFEHIYDVLLFSSIILVSFFLIYLERFNSIEIIFQEHYININFFLIGKKIKIKYSDVLVIDKCFGKVSGSTLRLKVIHKNKKYVFRLYGYSIELYNFITSRTQINNKI